MKILALELSSSVGSIAWREENQKPFSCSFPNDRKHSGVFFENLERTLDRFGRPERIVVGLGPGSYAGTRIAIATAVGVRSATGARLVGLPSICALPAAGEAYAVIGDARRLSFFFIEVRERRCVGEPELLSEVDLRARLASSHQSTFTAEPLRAFPEVKVSRPSALLLAQLAGGAQIVSAAQRLEPIYLREPHITQAKPPASCLTQ